MAPPNLMSVESMLRGVRNLLLDKVEPYRYSDKSLLASLNVTLNEARRLRPDIFIDRYGVTEPDQYEEPSGLIIPVERQFRLPIEYGVAGHALLRDEEDIQDARANTFKANFEVMLVGRRVSTPIEGGTPVPQGRPRSGPGMGPGDTG